MVDDTPSLSLLGAIVPYNNFVKARDTKRFAVNAATVALTLGLVASCSMSLAGNSTALAIPISQQKQEVVYTCRMHPEIRSSTPGKCPKCGMTLVIQESKPNKPASASSVTDQAVNAVAPDQSAEAWTCPMHPYLRLDKPGKCPKCGMTLVPANPSVLGKYSVEMEVTPNVVRAGEKIKLAFDFYEPGSGKQVAGFSPTHTKLFHLFIVSQDMTFFEHIHPELEPDGTFTIETILPRPGIYKVYCDVYPSAGTPQVLQTSIATAGYHGDLFASRPNLVPDSVLSKTIEGMKVDVTLDPSEIIAGQPVDLKFHLTDAKTGAPVRDLEPYLGAWGHMLILSEDQIDYVHSHPSEIVPESENPAKVVNGGPDVTFTAFLPRPGNYRMWTQFQRGSKLITVSFTLHSSELQ
ncbi:MAG TPA: heavy metal-binding domain-containing protein [Blastocatellia bacterium]|nr:heavy metal-binding domain-containing protein [Blastocatellia bacterium]